MAVRVLLVLVAFTGLYYGCGRANTPVEQRAKQEGVEKVKSKEPKKPAEQATMKGEDFADREAAQEYLDSKATDADKEKIDPDSSGKACDEAAYLFAGGAQADEPTNIPTTASSAAATASVGPSGPIMSKEEAAAQAEAACRIPAYVQEQDMSQQEANDFSTRVANEMADRMMKDHSLPDSITAGPVENQVLDDFDVPRYPGCKGGTEE